jgi:hypothetical protein
VRRGPGFDRLGATSEGGFELGEIDIDDDDDLHARFLERIPVVEVDGEIVAELHLEPAALREALAQRGTGTVRSMTNDPATKRR